MLELSLPACEEIEVSAAPAEAFALLSDVRDSAAHFPQLEALEPAPGEGWTWRLDKIGLGPVSIQTVYGLRYRPDAAAGRISWEPLEGIGNARARGSWTILPREQGALLRFESCLEVAFRGVPSLLRRAVEPLAVQENERVIRAYLANLARTFAGQEGRVHFW